MLTEDLFRPFCLADNKPYAWFVCRKNFFKRVNEKKAQFWSDEACVSVCMCVCVFVLLGDHE